MVAQCIDPTIESGWDKLVWSHPKGTLFHTSNWARVIQKSYGYKPVYLVLETSGREAKSGIPLFVVKTISGGRRLVCLPHTDQCSPLLNDGYDPQSVVAALLKVVERERIGSVEIRGELPDSAIEELSYQPYRYYRGFYLSLDCGKEALWRGFKQKSVRYSIKRAERSGVVVETGSGQAALETFYRLNLLTRKKHGVIPQPRKFFRNLFEEILSRGLGFLLLARIGSSVIAGSIFLVYKDTVYYKYNASDARFSNVGSNYLLIWSALKWAVEKGYRFFDFGRTAQDNLGLVSFKQHWGTLECELPYYYWPKVGGITSLNESDVKYRIASALLRRTPVCISELASNLLYRFLS